MADETPAYYSMCRHGCGRTVFVAVDVPDMAKSNAKEIARLIRDGYTVEHSTVAHVKTLQFGCDCPD